MSLQSFIKGTKDSLCNPSTLASLYGLLAISSSIAIASTQGYLVNVPESIQSLSEKPIIPLILNISTLFDFVLLNPLAIYLLQRSSQLEKSARKILKSKRKIPTYHRFGLTILSVVAACMAMKFYIKDFLTGKTFDSNILPNLDGAYITASGWVVFFWTTLFIAFLFYRSLTYSWHVLHIFSLDIKSIKYSPYHQDEAGGLRYLMMPSLMFIYAMIALLAIFILFIIQDVAFDIKESNRVYGFYIYIVVSIPLFYAPLLHIHLLMKGKQKEYLGRVNEIAESILEEDFTEKSLSGSKDYNQNHVDFISRIESISNYKKIISTFPIWPLPCRLFITPIASFFGALAPVLLKSANSWIVSLLRL